MAGNPVAGRKRGRLAFTASSDRTALGFPKIIFKFLADGDNTRTDNDKQDGRSDEITGGSVSRQQQVPLLNQDHGDAVLDGKVRGKEKKKDKETERVANSDDDSCHDAVAYNIETTALPCGEDALVGKKQNNRKKHVEESIPMEEMLDKSTQTVAENSEREEQKKRKNRKSPVEGNTPEMPVHDGATQTVAVSSEAKKEKIRKSPVEGKVVEAPDELTQIIAENSERKKQKKRKKRVNDNTEETPDGSPQVVTENPENKKCKNPRNRLDGIAEDKPSGSTKTVAESFKNRSKGATEGSAGKHSGKRKLSEDAARMEKTQSFQEMSKRGGKATEVKDGHVGTRPVNAGSPADCPRAMVETGQTEEEQSVANDELEDIFTSTDLNSIITDYLAREQRTDEKRWRRAERYAAKINLSVYEMSSVKRALEGRSMSRCGEERPVATRKVTAEVLRDAVSLEVGTRRLESLAQSADGAGASVGLLDVQGSAFQSDEEAAHRLKKTAAEVLGVTVLPEAGKRRCQMASTGGVGLDLELPDLATQRLKKKTAAEVLGVTVLPEAGKHRWQMASTSGVGVDLELPDLATHRLKKIAAEVLGVTVLPEARKNRCQMASTSGVGVDLELPDLATQRLKKTAAEVMGVTVLPEAGKRRWQMASTSGVGVDLELPDLATQRLKKKTAAEVLGVTVLPEAGKNRLHTASAKASMGLPAVFQPVERTAHQYKRTKRRRDVDELETAGVSGDGSFFKTGEQCSEDEESVQSPKKKKKMKRYNLSDCSGFDSYIDVTDLSADGSVLYYLGDSLATPDWKKAEQQEKLLEDSASKASEFTSTADHSLDGTSEGCNSGGNRLSRTTVDRGERRELMVNSGRDTADGTLSEYEAFTAGDIVCSTQKWALDQFVFKAPFGRKRVGQPFVSTRTGRVEDPETDGFESDCTAMLFRTQPDPDRTPDIMTDEEEEFL